MQKKIYISDEIKNGTWSQATKRKVSEDLFIVFHQYLNESKVQCYSNDMIQALIAVSGNYLVKMRTFKDIANKNKNIENGWAGKTIYKLNINGISVENPTHVINKQPDIILSVLENGVINIKWYKSYDIKIKKKLKEPQNVRIKVLPKRYKKLLFQLIKLGCSIQLSIELIRNLSKVSASDSSYRRLLKSLSYCESELYKTIHNEKAKYFTIIYFQENRRLKPIFLYYNSGSNEVELIFTNLSYSDEEKFRSLANETTVYKLNISESYKKIKIGKTHVSLDIIDYFIRKVSNRAGIKK